MSKDSKFILSFKILQNGRPIKEFDTPYGKNQRLFVTNNGDDPLGITHYPLVRPISIIEVSKNGIFLEIDLPWEGFVCTKGEITDINGYHDLGKSFQIKPGDSFSIAWNDLRVLAKISPRKGTGKKPTKLLAAKYRGPIFGGISPSKGERRSSMYAIFLTGIIFATFLLYLNQLNIKKPNGFERLPIEYVGPFVSPDHFLTAPEALQEHLDRKDYLGSIFKYYRSMTSLLLGQDNELSDAIFKSLVTTVNREKKDVQDKHTDALQTKSVENEESKSNPGTHLMSLPAVHINSHREITLALIERVYRLHEGFDYSREEKHRFTRKFEFESGYDWSDDKNNKNRNDKNNIFKKRKRGIIRYPEALTLGRKVELMQNQYLSKIDAQDQLTQENINSIFLNVNGNHLSFLNSLKHIKDNEKKGEVTAAIFGKSPKIKIAEPLIGNINKTDVVNFLSSKKFDVQLCYESALRRDQNLIGQMSWQWIIDTKGDISDIELIDSEIDDQKLVRCIRKKLARWKFPSARRGSVKISHRFNFRPLKG